ncbi:MAG: helix-turn-helix transcriptional regulator [Clostridiales bacterium]|nr:helix-turn-helix transcriptional regulator [Clostridiales bacterium]
MLKYLRLRENLSQSELAEKLGVAKSTISMYEVGKREPDFETLEAIADLFNVDMNFLLGKDGSENDRYYINDETAKAAQEIFENKELRALFDVQRDMEPDDLRALHNMALALKRKERGNDDTGC